MTIDELLKTSYWVIDILPAQVPKDGPGQYFAVEKYFLDEKRLAAIKEKHINLVLKLNCYRQISIDGGAGNPAPELVAAEMRKRYLHIMVDESMILSEPDDADLTIFNPDAELLDLIREIAAGEGLYVWKPPFDGKEVDKVSLVTFSPTGSSMAVGRRIADTMAEMLSPKAPGHAAGAEQAGPDAGAAAVADLKYTVAQEGSATRDNTNAKVQQVLDKLCQLEMDGMRQNYENRIAGMQNTIDQLRTMNSNARFDASQNLQTAQILADNAVQTANLEQYLAPTPRPAYVVQNPNCCGNYGTTGCGCGSF